MKIHNTGRLFALLSLAVLFLAACQPAAPEITSPLTGQAGVAEQPVEADTDASAPNPTADSVTTENSAPVEPTEALSTAEPSGDQIPDGWNAITDSSKGYSLAYPPEWRVCEEHRYSRIFCEIQEEPVGMGPPLRLYVSVFPQDYTNADFEVYNFVPTGKIREYMALPVGEAMPMQPGPLPEYLTYTRLPDRMVAGWTALVIENAKVWEFPPETRQRVVMIVTESTTYIIGMYYETPQQLEMFEQVLDGFQIVP